MTAIRASGPSRRALLRLVLVAGLSGSAFWIIGVASVLYEAKTLVPDVSAFGCRTCATDLGPPPARWLTLAEIPAFTRKAFAATRDWRYASRPCISAAEALSIAEAEWRERLGAKVHLRYCRTSLSLDLAQQVPALAPQRGYVDLVARILTARELESRFTKDEFLEIALNRRYFGEGANGIDAAAQNYFGISPTALNTDQSVALTGASPRSIRGLIESPELLSQRRAFALDTVAGELIDSDRSDP